MSPRRLQDVLKRCLQDMSWRDVLKTSWRQTKFLLGISVSNYGLLTNLNKHLTNLYFANLHVSTFRLPRRLQDIFQACSRRLTRCLQDVFKTYLQDVLEDETFLCWRRAEDVLKTCLEEQQMFAGKWSVTEHCVAKILLAVWQTFLYENNCKFDSYKFSYKCDFSFFSSNEPKTRTISLGSWWSGNKKYFRFLFIASHTLFERHAEFNNFLKWNFWHVILLRL